MGSSKKRKAREETVKKRLARKRQQAQREAAQPPVASRIAVTYSSPEALVSLGPMVKASWHVPPALAQALQAVGRPVPGPVWGYMLVDTGATATCMALDAAEELGLTRVRLQKTYGIGGLHENPMFEALLMIAIDNEGVRTTITANLQIMGVPELGTVLSHVPMVTDTEAFPKRLIGLLGRDFLRHATLTYRGSQGVVEIKLDLATMGRETLTL